MLFSLAQICRMTGTYHDTLGQWVRGGLLRPAAEFNPAGGRGCGVKLDIVGAATAVICSAFRQRNAGRLPTECLMPVAEFLRELGEETLREEIAIGKSWLVFGGDDLPPLLCRPGTQISKGAVEGTVLVMHVNIGGVIASIDKMIADATAASEATTEATAAKS